MMETRAVQTAPRPRGRPRSARAHEAIIDAVLAMLAEGTTIEALSMEAVAARAGVGKATIYRRWPHKDALVIDAVASIKEPLPAVPGDSVREDLVLLVRAAGRARSSRTGQIMPCMIPELQRPGHLRDEYIRLMEARREIIREVLRRGIITGELRPDIDIELACTLLVAPVVMSLLGSHPRLDPRHLAERVVDTVLFGIAATPSAASEPAGPRKDREPADAAR
jgi:AcrR family transcriptional regulator